MTESKLLMLVLVINPPLSSQFGLVDQSFVEVSNLMRPLLDFSEKEDANVTAGTRVTLVCGVDEPYEWCTFSSPGGGVCDFRYKYEMWKGGSVIQLNCSLGGGATFRGNYQENQCAIEVDIGVSDSGNWSCSVEEYRIGGSRGSGLVATGYINLEVEAPATTTVPNIQAERRAKSLDMEEKEGEEGVKEEEGGWKMMGDEMKVAGSVIVAVGMFIIALVIVLWRRSRVKKVTSNVQVDKERMQGKNSVYVASELDEMKELDQMKEYFPHVINFPEISFTYEQQTSQLEDLPDELDNEDYMDMKIENIPFPS